MGHVFEWCAQQDWYTPRTPNNSVTMRGAGNNSRGRVSRVVERAVGSRRGTRGLAVPGAHAVLLVPNQAVELTQHSKMRSKLSLATTAMVAVFAGAGVHSTAAAGTGCRDVCGFFLPQQNEVCTRVCVCAWHGDQCSMHVHVREGWVMHQTILSTRMRLPSQIVNCAGVGVAFVCIVARSRRCCRHAL